MHRSPMRPPCLAPPLPKAMHLTSAQENHHKPGQASVTPVGVLATASGTGSQLNLHEQPRPASATVILHVVGAIGWCWIGTVASLADCAAALLIRFDSARTRRSIVSLRVPPDSCGSAFGGTTGVANELSP